MSSDSLCVISSGCSIHIHTYRQTYLHTMHATHPLHGSACRDRICRNDPLLHDIVLNIAAYIYTNKNLLYTAGASRMVCRSAYLGPCSYIGPKRPIKNKKLFRVYGKVLYTEHRLSAHSYLVYIWYVFHTQNTCLLYTSPSPRD